MGGAHGRGILYPARLPTFTRRPSPPDVAHLVVHFWIPEWSLAPGRTSRQHVISFPASNLVVEPGRVGLAGPTTRRSHRDLTGVGWAVGALLRPAAVPSLTDDPAATVDGYVPVDAPELLAGVEGAMTESADPEQRRSDATAAFADWWRARMPERSDEADLANRMAELLATDPHLLTTAAAAERLHVSERTLQRLAVRYVGLPPAAMIRRRRLQEAAEWLRDDPDATLAAVAHDLGYSDHAHLTRDFRAVLGLTPSRYRSVATSETRGPDPGR